MDRVQKQELVATMRQAFASSGILVVTHYSGMTVAEMTDMRRKMLAAGASVRVTKNRLARLALEGTDYEGMSDMLTGPTAIAYSVDPVAAAKVAVDFAKTSKKLLIIGGSLGRQILDEEGVRALASLPSLDELRARLVGMVNTPATRVAQVLSAPAGQLARVFAAYADKDKSEAA